MKTKRIIVLLFVLVSFVGAQAASTVVWKGSKHFASWTDVVNISGEKFNSAKADDILLLSITAESGAQLQISYGSGWTNFEGLTALSVKGDYQMVLNAQTIERLCQGIHIKGINYTLTSVSIESSEGQYSTSCNSLFDWSDLQASGTSLGETSTMGIQAYGGCGWYWSEPIDLSAYGSIEVELLRPVTERLIVQLLYDDTGVKAQQIAIGGNKCKITLDSRFTGVYSLSFMSEKAQTLALASVNLLDKQGNPVTSAINSLSDDEPHAITEHYNISGIRLSVPQSSLNIVKTRYKDGRVMTRKVWKR